MEDVRGGPAIHAATLVRPLGVVGAEIGIEVLLHFLVAFVELLSAHDAEVLVEKRSVQPLDESV